MAEAEALKLFFSYSHLDESLRNELGNHLKILEYQNLISGWHDRKILPGEEWDHQISSNLETADIILLLISADFIASRYCWEIEINKAMELHEAGKACVIPVILRDANWQRAPFGKLQALPQNAVAVTSSPNKDAAFTFVAQEIEKKATAILQKRQQEREKQRKETASTQYRQKYLEFLADGAITLPKQYILKDIQKRQGLTDEEVAAIKAEIVSPTANPENLEEYRQVFLETITQLGYPLNEQARGDLKLLQEHLGLSDADISQIEAPIITEKEQKGQQKQQEVSRFEFDVITVDNQGKENSRKRTAAEFFTEDLGNGQLLEMVKIPAGTFQMGSPPGEGYDYDKPQHKVTISTFFMGKYTVTQAQWKIIASRTDLIVERDITTDPSYFKGDDRPVEQVGWYDAIEFCARLSKLTGREYRLPSEAEWEYACRAGMTTPFYFGETITTNLVNYDGNYTYKNELKDAYREQTTPVGQFLPNAFGLYDMHGNVWEWCLDDWHNNYESAPTDGSPWLSEGKSSTKVKSSRKVIRGGSWAADPRNCRSAFRSYRDSLFDDLGFRVVCVSPRTP